jgi:hypothetical protein
MVGDWAISTDPSMGDSIGSAIQQLSVVGEKTRLF